MHFKPWACVLLLTMPVEAHCEEIALMCDGTFTDFGDLHHGSSKEDVKDLPMLVDLTNNVVKLYLGNAPGRPGVDLPIIAVLTQTIRFRYEVEGQPWHVGGDINRVSGDATIIGHMKGGDKHLYKAYTLKCRPKF